jgi:patatin-like phospholipase/acyl hydrolase
VDIATPQFICERNRNVQEQQQIKPLRVLCLDGGGMRGIYTAEYLSIVASAFARRRGAPSLGVGAGFDLIAGTSTGAIIGCGLALGIPIEKIVQLYRRHGKAIFPRKLPDKLSPSLAIDLRQRPKALRRGEKALRSALDDCFGTATIGSVYAERKIALAVPAVDMAQHRSWVFKTPHLPTSNNRDDNYRLVDVCLATSAAPLFRSLHRLFFISSSSGEIGAILSCQMDRKSGLRSTQWNGNSGAFPLFRSQ